MLRIGRGFMMFGLLFFLLAAVCGADAAEPAWQESFDQGIDAAHPYHNDGKTALLEATAEGTIRATLPGQRPLEGFRLTATGLTENRMVTVKATVRGNGKLLLALHSGNGWLYAPVHTLTADWQELSVAKTTGPRDTTLSIYFISPDKPQAGTVCEVDDVQAFVADSLEVADVELAPRRFEAEAFASLPDMVAVEKTASDKRCVTDTRSLRLDSLPFPRTSRLVSVYVRACSGASKSQLRLVSERTGRAQTIRSLPLPSTSDWQWLCFPAVSVEETGDAIDLLGRVEEAGGGPLAVDSVVLATDPKLDAAVLDTAHAGETDAPTVRVSRALSPPKVDGKPDDSCWAHAVAIADFLAYDTFTPLAEPTKARFLYDDTHLYVLLEAQEPVLEVAAQRRHEIRAKATDRDGQVLRDDSCMVLLSPGGDDGYEFSVNTIGTLLDARCQMRDLWGTRDVEWNANVEVTARQEDGYWVAEQAIPLADLGARSPLDGQRWQVIVARVAQTRGERGTWNHSQGGAHRPQTLGTMVFGDPAIGLVPEQPLQMLQPGSNALDVTLGPQASGAGLYLGSQTASSGEAASRTLTFVPVQATKATHTIEMKQSGPVEVKWFALDAATLEPLYVSPAIRTSVQSSRAVLTVSTGSAYRVVVNDQTIASGNSAAGTEIQLPLRQGENVIAVEAASGLASLQLKGPSETHTPTSWRMNEASVENPPSSRLDDRTWPIASPANEASGDASTLGVPGAPRVFRHTMLLSHTRIWPKPEPALYVAAGGVQSINFTATGLAGKQLADWQVYVAVPTGYEVVGSTGYYGKTVATQPMFQCERIGDVTIDGETRQLHQVTATKPIRPGRHQIMSLFQLMVRIADANIAAPGKRSTWYYWTVANGGTVTEPQSSFTVEALPALAGRQPKQFALQLWGGIQRMDNDSLREPLLATLQAAGFNEFVSADRWLADHGDDYGLRGQLLLSFQSWSIDLRDYLSQHPEDRLIDHEGAPSDTLMCMTQLLGSGWEAADRQIAAQLAEHRPDIAQYDYEFPPARGPHSCYCPRCLEAFREHAKLDDDVALSPDMIREEFAEPWVDFMAWRVAQLLRKMKDSVHGAGPATKFSVYSGYDLPDNAARYGIQWRYVGQLQAADLIGCGYGRPIPAIGETLESVGGIPALFGVLLTPYRPSLDQPVTPASKARLLRRAIDATGGVLVYDRRPMDGRWWYAVAEVSRLIAAHEALFLHARPEPIADHDPAVVQILRGNEATLVGIMNDSGKPRNVTLTIPADLGEGREFYTNEAVHGGETVRLELTPGEVAVYAFGTGGS